MDNVIDNCEFPLKDIEKVAHAERRIGLGTMGIHDLLIALQKGYDTQEGREVADTVLTFIRDTAYQASIDLAKEKGSFSAFNKSKFVESGFIKTLPEELIKQISKTGIRNGALLSQAPTGTIGSMYNVSTGCEPWFAFVQQLNTRLGSYESGCAAYLSWKKNRTTEERPSYFKNAEEISPEDHVKMMVIFSKYVDSAVSKTVNLPSKATVDDVKKVYLLAMDNGVKGVTVFRDGCKKAVLVNKEKPIENGQVAIDQPEDKNPAELDDIGSIDTRVIPTARGNRTVGGTTRIHMDKHNMYVTVNKNYQGSLVEIFVTVGTSKDFKTGTAVQTSGVENSWANAVSKITSLALRAGVKPESIIKNLKNIPSDKPTFVTICDNDSVELIPSPPHAVGRVIEEEMRYTQQIQITNEDLDKIKGYCTNCGSSEITWRSSTCGRCNSCGNDDCGSLRRVT
jgi:ribonucleoside-diphosphate reductase alpha chain